MQDRISFYKKINNELIVELLLELNKNIKNLVNNSDILKSLDLIMNDDLFNQLKSSLFTFYEKFLSILCFCIFLNLSFKFKLEIKRNNLLRFVEYFVKIVYLCLGFSLIYFIHVDKKLLKNKFEKLIENIYDRNKDKFLILTFLNAKNFLQEIFKNNINTISLDFWKDFNQYEKSKFLKNLLFRTIVYKNSLKEKEEINEKNKFVDINAFFIMH